ncbi:MAG: penicillin-binding protein 2 [Planctomycetes bacterium]|nr:penicillin-binding protein 2 [Planctomycetota bacterium]
MRVSLRQARYRSVYVLTLCCLLLGAAGTRLFWLQVVHQRAPESVAAWRTFEVEESGRRGDLRDARGGILATSIREVDVRVWTSGVRGAHGERNPRRELAEALARLIGVDPARTERTLEKPGQWVLLARGIRDPGVIAELRDLTRAPSFRAVELETRFVREHPRGSLFAPLLGWIGWIARKNPDGSESKLGDSIGVAGFEARCEVALKPTVGRRHVRRDGTQQEMIDPELGGETGRDGRAVELTLDPIAQVAADEALDAAMEEFTPDWAQVLVLDPRTCDVLAISQRPTPAGPVPKLATAPPRASASKKAEIKAANEAALERHQLLAVHRVYPPGSAFKPLMLGLVFDQGKATPETMIDCSNGSFAFGKRVVHDVHPQSVVSATGVLVESSNIGMAKLVLSLLPVDTKRGDSAFQPILDHLRRLGFGLRVGGFAGEENGMVPPLPSMDRNYSLASLSFGQQIQVTALQMATACASIASGGIWRAPRLVRAIEGDGQADPAGGAGAVAVDWVEVPPLPGGERVVFSARTAAMLRGMLERVVEDGATKRWKPRGWSMGGKTGTAEHEKDRSISINSYWCFAPVAAPRFLVMAVLYHPRKGRFAADNAGKVGGAVMGSLLERFEVPRDRPEEVAALGSKPRSDATESFVASTEAGVVASPAVGEGR